MTDRRERVARAISEEFGNSIWTEWFGEADAAIAAMGLPTREQIEAALDTVFLLKLNWLGARLEHGDSGPNTDPAFEKYAAARQRLIALIPMKEADDV